MLCQTKPLGWQPADDGMLMVPDALVVCCFGYQGAMASSQFPSLYSSFVCITSAVGATVAAAVRRLLSGRGAHPQAPHPGAGDCV
jgi:hypothetical protein